MTTAAKARPVDHLGIRERVEMLERALCRPGLRPDERRAMSDEYIWLKKLMEDANV